MDFKDTPDEAEFRSRARQFLEAHAARREPGSIHGYRDGQDAPGALVAAKLYQSKKAECGFAGISWRREWGGQGLAPIFDAIFSEEEAHFDVDPDYFSISLGFALPTLFEFGPIGLVDKFAGPALKGDDVWCQLFSEPNAGSDLAGVRCRAERVGDNWRINGQKVWTSGAHYSQWAVLLARSDMDQPKHKGLTYFYLRMDTPGITVKPIRQMTGASHFNEVFIDDVMIPDSQRVGVPGEGWKVAVHTLLGERFVSGVPLGPDLSHMRKLISSTTGGNITDSGLGEQIAHWFTMSEALKYTRMRSLTALSNHQQVGSEAAAGKLVMSVKIQELARLCLEIIGSTSVMTGSESSKENVFARALMYSPAMRIAGGTDEVMKNIIAERVLGLPREPSMDSTVPFRELISRKL